MGLTRHQIEHSLPARIFHWLNAAVLGLMITSGLYISNPERFDFFTNMNLARKTHFITMYLLIYGILLRAYYSYVSKDYRELKFGVKDIRGLPAFLRYYFFLSKDLPQTDKYNPGQKLLYGVWMVLLVLQIVSGFALYFPIGIERLVKMVGGFIVVREVHLFVTWIFISSIAVHIYMSFISGWAVIKSMIVSSDRPKNESHKSLSV